MTKAEIDNALQSVKPLHAPYGCKLDLMNFEGDEVKLKLTCPPLDIFKVQGKIVKVEDDIKNKISERLAKSLQGAKISFV